MINEQSQEKQVGKDKPGLNFYITDGEELGKSVEYLISFRASINYAYLKIGFKHLLCYFDLAKSNKNSLYTKPSRTYRIPKIK